MNKRTRRARHSQTSTSLWGLAPFAILVVGLGYMSAAAPTPPLGGKVGEPVRTPLARQSAPIAVASPSEPVLLAQATPKSSIPAEAIERPSDVATEVSSEINEIKKDDTRGEAPPGPAEYAVVELTGMEPPPHVPDNFLNGEGFSAAQGLLDEKEPNDTAATATPLGAVNVVAKGNIYKLSNGPGAATGDIDVWSFNGTAGDRVYAATMTSFAPSTSTDTTLELVGTDGTTILETDLDDGGFSTSSSTIAGRSLPATGTF